MALPEPRHAAPLLGGHLPFKEAALFLRERPCVLKGPGQGPSTGLFAGVI